MSVILLLLSKIGFAPAKTKANLAVFSSSSIALAAASKFLPATTGPWFANKIAEKAFNDVNNFSWFKRGQRICKFITDRINK